MRVDDGCARRLHLAPDHRTLVNGTCPATSKLVHTEVETFGCRSRHRYCRTSTLWTVIETSTLDRTAVAPSVISGAISGVLVVLAFTVAHDVFISDIWFNAGPMMFAGALCGLSIAWSYRTAVGGHTTFAWLRYNGIYAVELIVLGALSLAVLRPRWSMAELMVADDAFDRLLPPSMPLIAAAIVVGTVVIWLSHGRRPGALVPILLTHVLLVFLLGHQFAFLGLVESTTALWVVFGEFALITVGLAAAFGLGVMWLGLAWERRPGSRLGP